jgi:hypothetical protein
MARTEARIFTRIWKDPEFRSLSLEAQWLWFCVLSQADLSYCGVLPFSPGRWADLGNTTPSKVRAAVRETVGQHFIVVDEKTEEVWVRTLIQNDGVLDQPNLIRAMARDFGAILSPTIREGILEGLGEGFAEGITVRFPNAFANPNKEGLPKPFLDAFCQRFSCACAPSSPIPYPLSTPKPSRGSATDFDRWWVVFPRKSAKRAAQQAWPKALDRAGGDAERLISAAMRYRDDPNRDPQYTPHPATWLNQDRWDDEPLPPRTTNGTKPQVREPDNLGEPFPAWGVTE